MDQKITYITPLTSIHLCFCQGSLGPTGRGRDLGSPCKADAKTRGKEYLIE